MKQNYELTYIVSGQMPEEAAGKTSQQISDFIQSKQGLILENSSLQKINLAYPIKKESTAWFQTVYFGLDTEFAPELEKTVKEMKDVLRYLFLKKMPYKAPKPMRRRKPKVISEVGIESKPSPSQKIELEEIGKKLDEILK
ncbi:MAG: 30S ribosomal protein S6 [bacterium]|nr:30S ribosomal protein S6 [bacterium]